MTDGRIQLSQVPLLFPLSLMMAGIAAGTFVVSGWIWVLFAAGIAGGVWCAFRRNSRWLLMPLFLIVGILLGWCSRFPTLREAQGVELQGEVKTVKDFGRSFRLVVEDSSSHRNYLLWASSVDDEIVPGDVVAFRGIAVPPDVEGTVPDEITRRDFVRTNRIYAEVWQVDSFRIVAQASGMKGWTPRLQRTLADKLKYSGLSQESGQLLQALLLGKIELNDDVRNNFSRSGLSHVLALSGTHIGVISLVIAMMFFPVTLLGGGRLGLVATLLLLWFYALLTGLSPSVVRAAVMISFVMGERLSGRFISSFNSLSAAAILILIFSPMSMFAVGFQMSFLAVGGILLFMPLIMGQLLRMKWLRRDLLIRMVATLLLPLAAMAGTAPLAVYYFHLFPAWFLVTNILISLLLPLILAGGSVLLLFAVCGVKLTWLAGSLDWLIDKLTAVGSVFSALQPDGLSALYPSVDTVLAVYAAIFMVWMAWNCRRRVYLYAFGVSVAGIVATSCLSHAQIPVTETYSWRAGNTRHLVYREGEDAVIVTRADEKYHGAIKRQAEHRLQVFLGRRGAALKGVVACDINPVITAEDSPFITAEDSTAVAAE